MGLLQTVYVAITAILALLGIWSVVKEEDYSKAMSLGVITIPLVLRALGIK